MSTTVTEAPGGISALRYHSNRAIVFKRKLSRRGIRSGGSSRMNSEVSPGIKRAARCPTSPKTAPTIPSQIPRAPGPAMAIIPKITPSWAEQGTARASNRVTNTRSLRVWSTRVVIVAMVTHPSPSTMGSTARPFKPRARKGRFSMAARRGRYPESSIRLNIKKKVLTMGSTMASP